MFGQSLVVRKDEMKEGDIVIYCPIETILNKDFLSANNLYEMGERKRNKKIKRMSRMVEGEFSFHFDTNQFNNNVWRFSPNDIVTISLKEHGTSAIFANILVKHPIVLTPVQRIINKHIKKTIRNTSITFGKSKNKSISNSCYKKLHMLEKHIIPSYTLKYGNVYSSRGVIKNEFIN